MTLPVQVSDSPQLAAPLTLVPWPLWRHFLLNFGMVYLALYFLVTDHSLWPFPPVVHLRFALSDALHRLLFGTHLHAMVQTGSGDTALDWTALLLTLLLALVGGLLWTPLHRSRSPERQLVWLSSGLRVALIVWLMVYGLGKFSFAQFGLLFPAQLTTTYGDSSPMGLLWRFMGASPAYQLLAGVAEVLPAVLLLHRRTVTLGALIAAVTLTNVFALNLFYDVPVKLFSGHLLLSTLILLATDSGRLQALVTGRAVPALRTPTSGRVSRWGSWLLTTLCLFAVGMNSYVGSIKLQRDRAAVPIRQEPLKTRGVHWVSEFPFNR